MLPGIAPQLVCHERNGLPRKRNTLVRGKTHIAVYFIIWVTLVCLLG